MEATRTECAARYRAALQRERAAWQRLEGTQPRLSQRRAEEFDRWLDANRHYRDAQAELTAVTVHNATQYLRDCAALLSSAADATKLSLPCVGARFKDREGAVWEVTAVVNDAFEADFFLLQLAREGAGDVDPTDVFSDDWQLFCLVHGLRAC